MKPTKHPRVVFGPASLQRVQPQEESAKAAVATLAVRKLKRCPVCNARAGSLEVAVGPFTVKICEPCFNHWAGPVQSVASLASVLKRFL